MAFSLIPREEKFFDLFEQQVKSLTVAASIFLELVKDWSDKHPGIAKLRDLEHECDITTHEIMDMLNRTFVTPFDREDIHALAKELDDVVDIIQAISERMLLFNITKTSEDLIELARTLEEAISNVSIEINRLENRGDRTSERAIGNLFHGNPDPMDVLKWKEIYDATESAIDKCEDIANIIEGIVVKHG
jgi:uncharacterized protein Yka (UPF0111/DUF47 family)